MFTPPLENMRNREMILDFQFSILTSIAITLFALNKWRFKNLGVVGVCMLIGLSVEEMMEPEHFCYSLLGGNNGGWGSKYQIINTFYNYTTALDTVEPGSQWSMTPKCYHMNTTSKLLAEPFGWIVNRNNNPTIFRHQSISDVLSLSLHGLTRTTSTGLVLYIYGCGWLPMLSGTMMGPIYALGTWHLPPIMRICPSFLKTNTCTSEFLWGMYTWMVLILALMVFRGSKRNDVQRTNTPIFFLMNFFLITFECITMISAFQYANGKDSIFYDQNKNDIYSQGVYALFFVVSCTIIVHIVYLWIWLYYRCHKNYRKEEKRRLSTVEFKGVRVGCKYRNDDDDCFTYDTNYY
jgi:hypothetical protein